jgi:hypothetical protein
MCRIGDIILGDFDLSLTLFAKINEMIPPPVNVQPAIHLSKLRFWSLSKGLIDV